MEIKAPWHKFYKGIRESLSYPEGSVSDAVFNFAERYPDKTALIYMGKKTSYRELYLNTVKMQKALISMGVKRGDRVTVCLPNIPEAVYSFYALNRMGAVVSFVHPLSAPMEFKDYISQLNSRLVITLDSLYDRFSKAICEDISYVIVSACDSMPTYMKLGYMISNVRKNTKFERGVIRLKKLLKNQDSSVPDAYKSDKDDIAVILFSGGTTGKPKGVMISNLGLNSMGMQTAEMSGTEVLGKSMLAAMPMFHGFGLAVCIHTMLISGGNCVLVPKFTPEEYARLIIKHRPDFIAGVPTLYEALLKCDSLKKADLSCLCGVFCGGDTLPYELKCRFDDFLKNHGAGVKVREGYGATECVTASCLTPVDEERKGSIGIPFPDVLYKICGVGSTQEVEYNKIGEICISGPAIMKGYLNDSEETSKALRLHKDGRVWLHTGDLGLMDEDGFVYFKQRIKRIIITSGYNVYPSRIEEIVIGFPAIKSCCVVGVEDAYKMQRVKLYAVLCEEYNDTPILRQKLSEHLMENIARYALPKEVVFLDSLPHTKFGKIDYAALEKM